MDGTEMKILLYGKKNNNAAPSEMNNKKYK